MGAQTITPTEDEDILAFTLIPIMLWVECEILTIFTVNEQDYIALLPLTEAGEPNEDGEDLYLPLCGGIAMAIRLWILILDDAEHAAVSTAFLDEREGLTRQNLTTCED